MRFAFVASYFVIEDSLPVFASAAALSLPSRGKRDFVLTGDRASDVLLAPNGPFFSTHSTGHQLKREKSQGLYSSLEFCEKKIFLSPFKIPNKRFIRTY